MPSCITASGGIYGGTEWRGDEEGVCVCATVPLMQSTTVDRLLDAPPTSTPSPRTCSETVNKWVLFLEPRLLLCDGVWPQVSTHRDVHIRYVVYSV